MIETSLKVLLEIAPGSTPRSQKALSRDPRAADNRETDDSILLLHPYSERVVGVGAVRPIALFSSRYFSDASLRPI